MKRIEKYNYAMELLRQFNIKTTDDRLTFNCRGDIVIHSKQLKNCIIIPPQATKRTIQEQIYAQIKITQ
jgi:hypothetical protein